MAPATMVTMSRTRETAWATPKGDERRAAILAALRDLLADRPLAEISVAHLTERAGVTRSAFYFYFDSKAAAVAALLADQQEQMLTAARAWYDGGPGTPAQRVRAGMRATIAEWRRYPTWFAAMADAAVADTGT